MKIKEAVTCTTVGLQPQRAHRLAMTTLWGHALLIVQMQTGEGVTAPAASLFLAAP